MLLHGLQTSMFIPQSLARSAFGFSPYLAGGLSVVRDVVLVAAKNLPLVGTSFCRSHEDQFEELASFTLSRGMALKQLKRGNKGKKGFAVKSRRMRQLHGSLKSKATPFSLEPACDFSQAEHNVAPLHDNNTFKLSMGLQSSLL